MAGSVEDNRLAASRSGQSLADEHPQRRAAAESLRRVLRAAVVEVVASPGAHDRLAETVAAAPSVSEEQRVRVRAVAIDELMRTGELTDRHVRIDDLGWQVWIAPISTYEGSLAGALVVARPGGDDWSEDEALMVHAHSALLGSAATRDSTEVRERRQRHLDELVTRVAMHFMSSSRASFRPALLWTLQTLVDFLGVDTVYFRRNDHEAGASILIDEWPRRESVPDPDPLGVVPFEGSDPVFAAIRDLREPFVVRPESSPSEYQERVEQGSGVPQVSMVMVPLLGGDRTEGVLGFVNFGDRAWEVEEINALRAIASLLMQLQARVDAEDQLHFHARHDELTGLANRRALFEALDQRLATRESETVAVLFIDLDQFKGMNDALGHGAGDQLLMATADRLRTLVRPIDLAARVGGDEFVVVLGGAVTGLEAFAVADRLLTVIAQPIDLNGQLITRTASLGIAVSEAAHVGAQDLLARADAALYAAKERGRNQIVIFDEELRSEVDERFNLEISLRTAIDDAGLALFYQPEVDLRTGRLRALEALVRWNHPSRGLLEAGSFITVAEDTGLIVDLGQWVLEEACAQLTAWLDTYPGFDFKVWVNMAPAQLMSRNLLSMVTAALEQHSLNGDRLGFEITERAVMQDVERSIAMLHEVRSLGIGLAIDDFGTGQSSMAQLKRLPVTTLKIDKSFVAGLRSDRNDTAIVESIVRLAQTFGLDIVAEGVETMEQAKALQKLGCKGAQGFLLTRPVPAGEVEPLLAREISLPPRHRIDLGAWRADISSA